MLVLLLHTAPRHVEVKVTSRPLIALSSMRVETQRGEERQQDDEAQCYCVVPQRAVLRRRRAVWHNGRLLFVPSQNLRRGSAAKQPSLPSSRLWLRLFVARRAGHLSRHIRDDVAAAS